MGSASRLGRQLEYAHRPTALRLLEDASLLQTEFGLLQIVSAEGLIGLKLQAIANNPRRTQDLEDIRALIANNRETQPLVPDIGVSPASPELDRDAFEALEDLMVVIEALCPRWPERPTFKDSTIFLL